jgi:nitrogenase molybdenum-iron protein alpha/beta subunit
MPTTRVNRAVTLNEAVDRLREQLGSQYTVTPHANGSRETIRVQRAGVAFCTVHLARDGQSTTFRVHGGGVLLGRLANELLIARTVSRAIKDSIGSSGSN